MGISILKWKFQKIGNQYYIKTNDSTSLYLTSTYTNLNSNPNIKCDTPVRLLEVQTTLPQLDNTFNPFKWEVSNKAIDKHTFYIRQNLNNRYIYLSVCHITNTLLMSYSKYKWNIINLDKIHQFILHDTEDYVIIDFKSTKAINVNNRSLTLSPTYFWRLVQNPLKNVKDPISINNLFQYISFFIYSNINQSNNNIYLSGEGNTTANGIQGYTLTGIDVDENIDCSSNTNLTMCNKYITNPTGLQSLKWTLTNNSLTNLFNNKTHLTYLPQGNIFYTISNNNSDWNILNLIRKNTFRTNDLIIIDTKLNSDSPNKTFIIDGSIKFNSQNKTYTGFKFIHRQSLNMPPSLNIMESCMNTNTLDLYVGKYNFAKKKAEELQPKINNLNSIITSNNNDINAKNTQLSTLQQNIAKQISEAEYVHHSTAEVSILQNKLNTNTTSIRNDIKKLEENIQYTKLNLNLLNIEYNNYNAQMNKWKKIIDDYDDECNKQYNNSRDENNKISKYISTKKNMTSFPDDIEYFNNLNGSTANLSTAEVSSTDVSTAEVSSTDVSTAEVSSSNINSLIIDSNQLQKQIDSQLNIINEKKNLINIRNSMLNDITRTNNYKRKIIYVTASVIILIIVIMIILYVRNNKNYIVKPEM